MIESSFDQSVTCESSLGALSRADVLDFTFPYCFFSLSRTVSFLVSDKFSTNAMVSAFAGITVTSPQQTNKQHHYSCASKALLHSFVLDQENAKVRAKQRNSIKTSKGHLRYPSDMTRRAAVRLARFVFSPERKSVFLTFRPGLFFFAGSKNSTTLKHKGV